jgi:chemotaxis signal transduction protein
MAEESVLAALPPRDAQPLRFLVTCVGGQRFAIRADAVERIIRMAALSPLPNARASIAGLLNLQGTVLLVVDPRRGLGLPIVAAHPNQQLVVVQAESRYVLWVDRAEELWTVEPTDLDEVPRVGARGLEHQVVRRGGEVVPILSLSRLGPGPRALAATHSVDG